MSERANFATPHYVTCRCQFCDGHIEFDANQLTEENNVFPCPHCGLETKLFIPQKMAGAYPPAVLREGATPSPNSTPPVENSEIPLPTLTQEKINSFGKRKNDALAAKLYKEGDQDIAMSFAEARRYVADPRFKLVNPETGIRFTPDSLEAFIQAKKLEKKIENAQIKLNEAHINQCWKKYNTLKAKLRSVVSVCGAQRISLTKAQCDQPVVQELIALLNEIEQDGFVADEGAHKLVGWLEEKNNSEIPAFRFLLETARSVLACGELTTGTIPEIDIALELQLAIERVLPKQVRDPIKAKRIETVDHMRDNVPASKDVLDYIRELGGTPRYGMTASEAEELKDELYHQPTTKQLAYIRALGANPPPDLTRQTASELIDKLLHPVIGTREVVQNTSDLPEDASKFKNFQMVDAKVVQVDAADDLALLKADGRFAPLPILPSKSVQLGSTVATIGFPDPGLQGCAQPFLDFQSR